MSHTKNKSGSPRFQVGNKVRVKPGVSDPDFPDMPLGGWSGTVTEIIEHGRRPDQLCDQAGQANSEWVCTRSTASDASGTDWIWRP